VRDRESLLCLSTLAIFHFHYACSVSFCTCVHCVSARVFSVFFVGLLFSWSLRTCLLCASVCVFCMSPHVCAVCLRTCAFCVSHVCFFHFCMCFLFVCPRVFCVFPHISCAFLRGAVAGVRACVHACVHACVRARAATKTHGCAAWSTATWTCIYAPSSITQTWSVSVHDACSLPHTLSRTRTLSFLPSRGHTHALSPPPCPF
jgi:hypothetical protein